MTWTKGKVGLVAAGVCAAVLVAVLAAVAAGGGRYLRDMFLRSSPDTAETVAGPGMKVGTGGQAVPDELYTWVDSNGVTHFSQKPQGKRAEKVAYDGSRITPLPPADTSLGDRLSALAGKNDVPTDVTESGDKPKGSQMLHNLRKELQENQQRMQEAKNMMTNDL